MHNNLRTNRLTKGIEKSKVFKIKKNKIKRAALVYLKINKYKNIITIPQRYLDTGKKTGITDDGKGLELFLGAEDETNPATSFGLNKLQYLCFAPGAAHKTKTWPMENVAELVYRVVRETPFKAVLLGSKAEHEKFKIIPENENVINLAGSLTLLKSAKVLKESAGIITNDSGLMHMASALQKPIIAIFGSTTRELGFFPYRSESTVIENENLWCRPCSHIGRNKCPLGHFKCMKEITVDRVFKEVKKIFKKI